ncbi:MAG: putative cupin superfamily sugar epimerase [Cyclobacteriaceae bacterium]|jgi:predicted cupin superfamily sugar epimerase
MKAQDWIKKLNLKPHPEGGHYAETFRSEVTLSSGDLQRNLTTSIYYMLESHEISHWHQLASDELWYFHAGSEVIVHMFDEGIYRQEVVGLSESANPQLIIPSGTVFAAEVIGDDSYSLLGCVVAPGFDFEDFRLVPEEELVDIFPEEEEVISAFAKS